MPNLAYDTVSRVTNRITTPLVQNDGNSTASRGNLTSITRYADPITPGGGITRTYTYDILGNLINAQLDCCNQKAFNYDSATQYAYLSSIIQIGEGLGATAAMNEAAAWVTRRHRTLVGCTPRIAIVEGLGAAGFAVYGDVFSH